jgi:hypothetical protein
MTFPINGSRLPLFPDPNMDQRITVVSISLKYVKYASSSRPACSAENDPRSVVNLFAWLERRITPNVSRNYVSWLLLALPVREVKRPLSRYALIVKDIQHLFLPGAFEFVHLRAMTAFSARAVPQGFDIDFC